MTDVRVMDVMDAGVSESKIRWWIVCDGPWRKFAQFRGSSVVSLDPRTDYSTFEVLITTPYQC